MVSFSVSFVIAEDVVWVFVVVAVFELSFSIFSLISLTPFLFLNYGQRNVIIEKSEKERINSSLFVFFSLGERRRREAGL